MSDYGELASALIKVLIFLCILIVGIFLIAYLVHPILFFTLAIVFVGVTTYWIVTTPPIEKHNTTTVLDKQITDTRPKIKYMTNNKI
jgi:hypothetical protein